ncbi:zinc finger protein 780A-like [Musca vetustissima]|uniref:zinc finger protein 780A-like n=1 Tax=Musca vetustissima TaxID=27455 RepID=UPI002AB6FBB2|nr:zinc finger protein 780A-like [Musca vetustissima]
MTQQYICRLCGNDYSDEFFQIYDENGNPSEGYKIAANFFNSRFLDLKNGNPLKSMCSDCWTHIYEFHKFQGFVFQMETNVIAKLQEIKENLDEENKTTTTKIESYEISDDSDMEDNVELTTTNSANEETLNYESDCEDDYDISYSELDELDTDLRSQENVTEQEKECKPENTTAQQNDRNHHNHDDDDDVDYNPKCERTKNRKRKRLRMKYFATPPQDSTYRAQQNPVFLKFIESDHRTATDADELIAQWLPKLPCTECNREYATFTLLKEHFQDAHKDKQFYVKCCQRNFIYRCQIAEHVCLHFDPYIFKCRNCGRVFTNRSNLCSHKNDHCTPLEPTRETRKTFKELDDIIAKVKPKLECVVCKETYDTFTLLKQHFQLKHSKNKFYVVCCRHRFATRYRMEEHIQTHLYPEDLKCATCSKCFATKELVQAHKCNVR